ncbi:PaaI family thioesterase [Teredinibacter sp. KSP-S5-2]|uniref:PaaI family thioesterase n=1 Tax=Teredinibacter sp. KSP-S5-2 TaxID=3034506 RepID=UPI0029350937|nr:PaaI family thioesterase [Teredinibacter sp. KSP-S5-2]WNO11150.1 PaaI family thioesterase [Teredinibacter sp. KSP-S5-2]
MNVSDMNGLQLMKAMANREIPLPNIANIVPMLDGQAARGKMSIRVRANENHLNSQNAVHGGFASTVLDTAMACAVHTMLNSNSGVCTIDLSLKYVKPIPVDMDLYAEGQVDEMTAQIGFASGRLRDDDGNIYVTASTSCMLLKSN